jgi:hypothetical protein
MCMSSYIIFVYEQTPAYFPIFYYIAHWPGFSTETAYITRWKKKKVAQHFHFVIEMVGAFDWIHSNVVFGLRGDRRKQFFLISIDNFVYYPAVPRVNWTYVEMWLPAVNIWLIFLFLSMARGIPIKDDVVKYAELCAPTTFISILCA